MRKKCLNMVHELARRDERVFFVGSDLGFGTLKEMREEFPDRFIMEGICEQNTVGLAAGLALEGKIPFVNTIATFIVRRALEQVAMDACLHDLPVRFIGNGGGLVYAPLGSTHLAVEDIALMRALPNMTIVCPADAEEMERFMETTLDWPHPIYIRLAKGYDPVVTDPSHEFAIGRSYRYGEDGEALLVTTGVGLRFCKDAVELLKKDGIAASILYMPTVKPLDAAGLCAATEGRKALVTVEEHTILGGLGSAVAETLMEAGLGGVPFKRVGLPDVFPDHYGTQHKIMERYGIWPGGIVSTVKSLLGQGE
ncbi:transketolase [Pseudodesulfovibrio cashew]|uniref:Transketolase n=1 Tax=Pseudodesulfovibrio cashew TaxID=2678688 RepID=A0A6I6J9P9_9BACT|nr:transketolase C-terminal domain-containing protein [Pseudodesulfovibrio cashew]QGY39375.1 transketolase [Pseudodesulfovibrio cashew]